jgi:hypothetical protein
MARRATVRDCCHKSKKAKTRPFERLGNSNDGYEMISFL